MTQPKKRKCKAKAEGCQGEYVCYNSFQPPVCANLECKVQWSVGQVEKKKSAKAKHDKGLLRVKQELLRPRSWHIKKTQAAINGYVRERDHGLPCICCGSDLSENRYGGAVDASHYRSRGSSPHLRFCLNNIAAGCVKCNRFLSGNSVDMRLGMIAKFGLERVEAVESDQHDRKYTIEYLDRMAVIFRKKTRDLKKRRNAQ